MRKVFDRGDAGVEGTPDGGDVGQGIAGAGKQGENCLFLKLNDFFLRI